MVDFVYNDAQFKEKLPIFGTRAFLELNSEHFGWFVDAHFILPFYIDRRYIFSKLVFTTSAITLSGGDEKAFLNAVTQKAKELKVDLISQPLASTVFESVPDESIYIEWGSYIVDLQQSEEEILKNIWATISTFKNADMLAKKENISTLLFNGTANVSAPIPMANMERLIIATQSVPKKRLKFVVVLGQIVFT